MVRFLAETMPAVTVWRKRERAADSNDPVAHLAGVRIAHLHRGQRLGGGDLHHRQIRILIHADYLAHAALKAFGVGGKLHVNPIRLLHHVIVSNDVAAGIHDEAGAERLTHLVTLFAAAMALAAKEPVEEVLKILVRTLAASGPGPHSGRRHHRPGGRRAPREDSDGGNGYLPEAGSRC